MWRVERAMPKPLETVVAAYVGLHRDEVVVHRGAAGKPELPGSPLHASLAHAGDAALVAVTAAGAVGVDVEPCRPDVDRWALVAHVLSPLERDRLASLPAPRRPRAVLGAWTRKEAVLKAAGCGLAVEPNLVEIGPGPRVARIPPELGPPSGWALVDLPLSGHVAAVALRGRILRVSRYDARGILPGWTPPARTVSA